MLKMFKKPASRKEKEDRLIAVHREVQLRWGRMTRVDEWEFIRERSDEELDKELDEWAGVLQFEKWLKAVKGAFKIAVWIFVVLGVAGLLAFGIKQLLALLR